MLRLLRHQCPCRGSAAPVLLSPTGAPWDGRPRLDKRKNLQPSVGGPVNANVCLSAEAFQCDAGGVASTQTIGYY
eukprot:2415990-Pyramimonas_sp.AAC.1